MHHFKIHFVTISITCKCLTLVMFVIVSYGCIAMTVSHYEQDQDAETEAAKQNSSIINFIIYSCVVPTAISHNVFREQGL